MIATIKKNFLQFLLLLFHLWLTINNESIYLENITYSSTFILLDNKIVDVAQDGIHFFDEQFKNEESTHFIKFSENFDIYNDLSKISMSQFSQKYEEYILILYKRILYIFDKEHNLKINFTLYDSIQDSENKIIAYNKENNYLHYKITSMTNYNLYSIIHFKYNLNSNNEIENTIENKKDISTYSYAFHCLFMAPLSLSSIGYDILNCFYISSWTPIRLFTSSYDPEQNFNEIESLKYYIEFDYFNAQPAFFGAITNEEKDKALIYFIHNENAGWVTFDYTNKL